MKQANTSFISVQQLMTGVQRALRAMVPIADDLGVLWREPENYLDWDAIARGIFDGLTLAAIRSSIGWADYLPIIDYDKRVTDYSQYSFVAVELSGNHLPLVCLETTAQPFDTCLVSEIGDDLKVKGLMRVPFGECQFAAVGRQLSGKTTTVDTIAW